MRIHTFLLAAGVVLAACSGGEEPVPSEPIVNDNPGRDIAIPRSVADGVRLSGVTNSQAPYFTFTYDEEGWLTGCRDPYVMIYEVVGHLDTIKIRSGYPRQRQRYLIYDIKRNADGHITSLVSEYEAPGVEGETPSMPVYSIKEKVAARFHYDEQMRLTGFEETGERWDVRSGDTVLCDYNAVFTYEYDGDAIRRLTSRFKLVPPLNSKSPESGTIVDFSGEEVENRYGTFDFFTSTQGQTIYWPLMMTGYMGEWAKRIPNKTHYTPVYIDEFGVEKHWIESDDELFLESDENGRLTAERGKFFHYLE